MRDLVDDLGEVPARFPLDQDRGDEELDVERLDTVRHPDERLARGIPRFCSSNTLENSGPIGCGISWRRAGCAVNECPPEGTGEHLERLGKVVHEPLEPELPLDVDHGVRDGHQDGADDDGDDAGQWRILPAMTGNEEVRESRTKVRPGASCRLARRRSIRIAVSDGRAGGSAAGHRSAPRSSGLPEIFPRRLRSSSRETRFFISVFSARPAQMT